MLKAGAPKAHESRHIFSSPPPSSIIPPHLNEETALAVPAAAALKARALRDARFDIAEDLR